MSNARPGLFASARNLLASALQLLQTRLELVANDVELGALRLFDSVVLALLAMLGIGMGLVMLCVVLLWWVQEAYRPQVLAAMALIFLAAGVAAVLAARRRLQQAGSAFEASRAELARDLAALAPRDPGAGA